MHHITLHKSSDDVDVTYKDVKFNVMRTRMKSGCLAAPEYDAFRSAITSRTWYVSTAWCINIDHLISYDTKKTEPRTSGARARVYRCAWAAENLTRVTLHPGWEITGPRLPLHGIWKKERFTRNHGWLLRLRALEGFLNNHEV